MQLSSFQALCLLPDGEAFKALRGEYDSGREKWHYRRFDTTLEVIHKLATEFYTATLCRRRGLGCMVRFGRHINLKADPAKVKEYMDANGRYWARRPKRGRLSK